MTFEDARDFAHSLHLKSRKEFNKWSKTPGRPHNIPSTPARVYANQGWSGFGDFLGTGNLKPGSIQWMPFEDARAFAHSLQLKGVKEWHKWRKTPDRPHDIPSNPDKVYANQGWNGYGDFLGNGNAKRRSF